MSRQTPLRSIQILRALAATLVVFTHSVQDSGYIAAKTGQPSIEFPYFDGGFGVDIFFVISGFIMIYTTASSFGQPGAGSTFFKRRFIRISPLYWLMTAAIIVVFVVAPKFLNVPIENWRSIITSCFFIPDIRGNGEVRPILAAGWTLNYEMFFYVIFALCLMAPLRRGVIWLCGFFAVISVVGAVFTLPGVALPFWTNSITLEFIFGVLIGLACSSKRSLPASVALPLAGLGVALAIAMGPWWGLNQSLPRLISGGVPAALLVAAAALGPNLSATRLVTVLVALGDASYSLYLTHPFVIRPLRNVWIALHGGALPLELYIPVCIVVAAAAAVVIHRLLERPLTGRLQRWSVGPTKSRDYMRPTPLNGQYEPSPAQIECDRWDRTKKTAATVAAH